MENYEIKTFTDAEIAGRKLYKIYEKQINGGVIPYEFTKYKYEKYDVIFPSIDRVDEIKNRDIYAGEYIDMGYMLEKIKYDELIKHNASYYVCFFKDCMMMWDIKNMPLPNFVKRWCTETTANNTYGEKKVLKTVCDLEYNNAYMVCFKGRILNEDERQRFKEYTKRIYHKYSIGLVKNNKENKDVA